MSSAIKHRLAILASGGGSNADKICTYFQKHPSIAVALILTNNAHAGVRVIAEQHGLPCHHIPKKDWPDPKAVQPLLDSQHITHIILAGFLLLIPDWMLKAYPDHIVNIHPALLPKYGGKGMYGHHVHEAVKKSGDLLSGITIHAVDEVYDHGDILFQHHVQLQPDDSAQDIAKKVLQAEHFYYPRVIERWITGQPMEDESR